MLTNWIDNCPLTKYHSFVLASKQNYDLHAHVWVCASMDLFVGGSCKTSVMERRRGKRRNRGNKGKGVCQMHQHISTLFGLEIGRRPLGRWIAEMVVFLCVCVCECVMGACVFLCAQVCTHVPLCVWHVPLCKRGGVEGGRELQFP